MTNPTPVDLIQWERVKALLKAREEVAELEKLYGEGGFDDYEGDANA